MPEQNEAYLRAKEYLTPDLKTLLHRAHQVAKTTDCCCYVCCSLIPLGVLFLNLVESSQTKLENAIIKISDSGERLYLIKKPEAYRALQDSILSFEDFAACPETMLAALLERNLYEKIKEETSLIQRKQDSLRRELLNLPVQANHQTQYNPQRLFDDLPYTQIEETRKRLDSELSKLVTPMEKLRSSNYSHYIFEEIKQNHSTQYSTFAAARSDTMYR